MHVPITLLHNNEMSCYENVDSNVDINEYFYQVMNGSCRNTLLTSPSIMGALAANPPFKLTEVCVPYTCSTLLLYLCGLLFLPPLYHSI